MADKGRRQCTGKQQDTKVTEELANSTAAEKANDTPRFSSAQGIPKRERERARETVATKVATKKRKQKKMCNQKTYCLTNVFV